MTADNTLANRAGAHQREVERLQAELDRLNRQRTREMQEHRLREAASTGAFTILVDAMRSLMAAQPGLPWEDAYACTIDDLESADRLIAVWGLEDRIPPRSRDEQLDLIRTQIEPLLVFIGEGQIQRLTDLMGPVNLGQVVDLIEAHVDAAERDLIRQANELETGERLGIAQSPADIIGHPTGGHHG